MALESSLDHLIIRNNIIDKSQTSSGTYTYDSHAWVSGAATIVGNTFIGPRSPGDFSNPDMLNLDNCSCIVKDNKFIRGSIPLNSYIRQFGSNNQTIVNNIFDSTTVDGTSDILVTGLSSTSQYYGNTNQTVYIPIPLAYAGFRTWADPGIIMDLTGGATNFSAQALSHHLGISTTRTTLVEFETNFTINNFLPEGIRVLEFKFGASRDSGSAALDGAASNLYSLNIKTIDTVIGSYASGTSSILDVLNTRNNTLNSQTVSVNLNTGTTFGDLQSTSQYSTIDVSANTNYTNNRNTAIILQFTCQFKLSSGGATLRFSAVVAKCRW